MSFLELGAHRCSRNPRHEAEMERLHDAENPTFWAERPGEAGLRARLTFGAGGPRLWTGTSYSWKDGAGKEAWAGLGIVKRALGRQNRQRGDVTAEFMDHV